MPSMKTPASSFGRLPTRATANFAADESLRIGFYSPNQESDDVREALVTGSFHIFTGMLKTTS
jgi:hypothetical protein